MQKRNTSSDDIGKPFEPVLDSTFYAHVLTALTHREQTNGLTETVSVYDWAFMSVIWPFDILQNSKDTTIISLEDLLNDMVLFVYESMCMCSAHVQLHVTSKAKPSH
jgi:hypothetical protein